VSDFTPSHIFLLVISDDTLIPLGKERLFGLKGENSDFIRGLVTVMDQPNPRWFSCHLLFRSSKYTIEEQRQSYKVSSLLTIRNFGPKVYNLLFFLISSTSHAPKKFYLFCRKPEYIIVLRQTRWGKRRARFASTCYQVRIYNTTNHTPPAFIVCFTC
jgi:hypothetical protein